MYPDNYMFFSGQKNLLLYKTFDKYFKKFKMNNENINIKFVINKSHNKSVQYLKKY